MIKDIICALAELLGIATDEMKRARLERAAEKELEKQRALDRRLVREARARQARAEDAARAEAYRRRMEIYTRRMKEADEYELATKRDLDENPYD